MDDPKRANLDAVSKSDTIPGGVPEELDDAALAAEQEAAAKAEPDIRTVLDNAGDIQGLNFFSSRSQHCPGAFLF